MEVWDEQQYKIANYIAECIWYKIAKKARKVEGRPFCSLSYRKYGTVKFNIDEKNLFPNQAR